MDVTVAGGFLRFFGDLPDPRGRNKIHQLNDMIVIAVMAVIMTGRTRLEAPWMMASFNGSP